VSAADADGRLVVLFDADCGFCSWSATVLDRLDLGHGLRLLPLQQAAAELDDAPPEEVLLETLHVRDRHGRWERGGAALLRIAAVVPLLRPVAAAGRVPLVRWGLEAWYRVVARNRHRLGRLLGLEACTYRGR
jgi:predicted DCC family thiol-disulfide oxidoreductase YuxK